MVIDELLRPDVARALLAELPRQRHEGGFVHVRDWGKTARLVDDFLGDPTFLTLLSALTKIPHLVHDASYQHAGLRISPSGGPWHVAPHELGWHRRLCVVINLTPTWIERAGHAPLVSPSTSQVDTNRCTIFEADDHSLQGFSMSPASIESEPARLIQAFYYERRRPTSAAPSQERRQSRVLTIEPTPKVITTGKTNLEEQRQAAWHGFEANVETLRALLDEDIARSRALALSLHRSFNDGTAPLTPDERQAWERVFTHQAELAKALSAAKARQNAELRASVAFPALPVEPATSIQAHSGFWRDRWVTTESRIILPPSKQARVLEVDGYLPARLAGQVLSSRVVGAVVRSESFGQGPFTLRIAVPASALETVAVELSAARSYQPSAEEDSPYTRELAWHLVKLRIA